MGRRATLLASSLAFAAAVLGGCEKTTTVTTTPSGTTTTTTIGATADVSASMARAGAAIGDATITGEVKAALLVDPDVKGLDVGVETHDGVVTLSGVVADPANVDRAVEIARKSPGVKSVENRLAVGPASATVTGRAAAGASEAMAGTSRALGRAGEFVGDAAITAQIKTALLADPGVKGLRVDVDTHDGVVTLSGTLDSPAHVAQAVAIARGTYGVKSVENRLAVR